MIESKRGCGFRKVGAKYLMGTGMALPCDALPLFIHPCSQCGFTPPFTRGLQRLNSGFIAQSLGDHSCVCIHPKCPLCRDRPSFYGLMWVGKKYYTPHSFVREARKVEVSKRIGDIPKWLKLGKTWVLLIHPQAPVMQHGLAADHKPAVFYAFIPQRIEILVWKSKATKRRLNKLKKQGLTPIIVPDGDKDHA